MGLSAVDWALCYKCRVPKTRTWPLDWERRRAGDGCPKCAEGRVDDDGWGHRFLEHDYADAYLLRHAPQPGYAVVVFRGGRHVADPCELTDTETVGYWRAIRAAVRGIEAVYNPCHVNYQILGNAVPHVHTHVVPRYVNDPSPERPLGDTAWARATDITPNDFESQILALRQAVGSA
jgi:diadenosine tetraphosphate (Ap4A) HIT family hydrolase